MGLGTGELLPAQGIELRGSVISSGNWGTPLSAQGIGELCSRPRRAGAAEEHSLLSLQCPVMSSLGIPAVSPWRSCHSVLQTRVQPVNPGENPKGTEIPHSPAMSRGKVFPMNPVEFWLSLRAEPRSPNARGQNSSNPWMRAGRAGQVPPQGTVTNPWHSRQSLKSLGRSQGTPRSQSVL